MTSMIPLDYFESESNNPATLEGYPGCMALFVAKDLTVGVDTEWVDRVNGISVPITALSAAANGDDNARDFNIADNTILSSGAWGDLTGKDFLMFAVAQIKTSTGDGGLTVGDGASGVRARNVIISGTSIRVVHDGTASDISAGSTAHTKNEVILMGLSVDIDGNAIAKQIRDNGAGVSDLVTFPTTNVSDFGGQPDAKIQLEGFENIYALAVMRLDVLLDDVDSMLLWNYYNFKSGKFGLYPALKGLL